MSNGYLLDTNAMIAILKGDAAANAVINNQPTYVPSIALGELFFGAENSQLVAQNYKIYEQFAAQRVVLEVDEGTARLYARVQIRLKRKGRPIQHNDMWIAALALQHNLTLLTCDGDFAAVDGLTVAGW